MKHYKKIFLEWKGTLFLLTLVLFCGFLIRFVRVAVGQQPIFGDEAIYIRWAQVMKAEPTLRFLPLSDGKQPLFMWVLMFLLREGFDPLVLGRLLSSVFGFFSDIGVFILSFILFKDKKVALIASLIYAISPFMVFFDSMALVDSMVAMFGVWTAIFAVLAVKNYRLDFSMLAGFFLGGGLLTKSPAVFYSLLLPTSWIFGNLKRPVKTLSLLVYLIKLAFLFIPTYLIGYGMYNVLRLGPNFHLISARNKDYVFPISHLWQNPKDPFIFHIKEVIEWFWVLGPGILLFLFILGLIVGLKFYRKQTIFLLAWILFPLFVNLMYARVFTARYILYIVPFVIVLSAVFVYFRIKIQILPKLLFVLFILSALLSDYLFIFDIQKAPLPRSERSGYLEEWTSGYGIKEVSEYIRKEYQQNPSKKIVVGTEGYFGTLPDGLQVYLNDYPQITVIGVGLDLKELPKSLIESKASGNRTFLVINNSRLKAKPEDLGLELVVAYPKALRKEGTREYNFLGPRETLYLFEVKGIPVKKQ